MHCKECQKPLVDGTKFCKYCGTPHPQNENKINEPTTNTASSLKSNERSIFGQARMKKNQNNSGGNVIFPIIAIVVIISLIIIGRARESSESFKPNYKSIEYDNEMSDTDSKNFIDSSEELMREKKIENNSRPDIKKNDNGELLNGWATGTDNEGRRVIFKGNISITTEEDPNKQDMHFVIIIIKNSDGSENIYPLDAKGNKTREMVSHRRSTVQKIMQYVMLDPKY